MAQSIRPPKLSQADFRQAQAKPVWFHFPLPQLPDP